MEKEYNSIIQFTGWNWQECYELVFGPSLLPQTFCYKEEISLYMPQSNGDYIEYKIKVGDRFIVENNKIRFL